MGEWCSTNLRDCKAWKDEGLEISTTSNECAKLYDATLRQLVSWLDCKSLGGIDSSKKAMLKADPDCIIARCLAYGMHALGTSNSVHKEKSFKDGLDKLIEDSKTANKREKLHARAVYNFAHGNMQSACVDWEKILAEYPNDLMALKFSHDGYFFLGDCYRKRHSVQRVIKKWKGTEPCYSYLHGMMAFGYEETGDYISAEKEAKMALEMQKQDCWATHAYAHCHEMNGRVEEGINFMESTVNNWEPCFILACHNFWHNALFYVEKGDYESALTIYDDEIAKRVHSNSLLDIVDAASMLQRLEMENIKTGNRWNELKPLAECHIGDNVLAFNDSHISMILSNINDDDNILNNHKNCLNNFIKNGKGDNWRITKDIGEQLSTGIIEFNKENYEKSFDLIYPIRHEIIQIGGSHAQRDVYAQILIHSALRSKNEDQKRCSKQLIDERNLLKPNSPLCERIVQKHKNILMSHI